MAMSYKEFVEATGAEVCGDRLIVGEMGNRRYVGAITDGTFTLNDEGQALLAELEAPTKKQSRKSAEDRPTAE